MAAPILCCLGFWGSFCMKTSMPIKIPRFGGGEVILAKFEFCWVEGGSANLIFMGAGIFLILMFFYLHNFFPLGTSQQDMLSMCIGDWRRCLPQVPLWNIRLLWAFHIPHLTLVLEAHCGRPGRRLKTFISCYRTPGPWN